MDKQEQQQLEDLLVAEAYFRAGMLEKAISKYPGVIPNDRLIACGDKCKARKSYGDAFKAYRQASATGKLIELGDLCANGKAGSLHHGTALQCFKAVNATERLIALGDKYLQRQPFDDNRPEDLEIALQAFMVAHALDKLVALGDACLEKNEMVSLTAYKEAGAVEKLLMIGDRFLASQADSDNTNPTHYACEAYRAAKANDKLLVCANWYIQLGKERHGIHQMGNGFKIYQEVGAELPMDLLNEVLDHHVTRGKEEDLKCVAQWIAGGLLKQKEQPQEANASQDAPQRTPVS